MNTRAQGDGGVGVSHLDGLMARSLLLMPAEQRSKVVDFQSPCVWLCRILLGGPTKFRVAGASPNHLLGPPLNPHYFFAHIHTTSIA